MGNVFFLYFWTSKEWVMPQKSIIIIFFKRGFCINKKNPLKNKKNKNLCFVIWSDFGKWIKPRTFFRTSFCLLTALCWISVDLNFSSYDILTVWSLKVFFITAVAKANIKECCGFPFKCNIEIVWETDLWCENELLYNLFCKLRVKDHKE